MPGVITLDGRQFDDFQRSFSRSRRTAIAAAIAAVGGVADASTIDAKKKKRKKKSKPCTGPCNYSLCLLYVDAEGKKLTPNLANQAAISSAKTYCCGQDTLFAVGKDYRNRVVGCVQSVLFR